MWKWRTALAAISFVLAFAGSVAAYRLTGSAQGNAGDVWVDNVGQPSGPGHEQDPHLMCADINLWGNGLADGSGSFIIDSWSPTGNGAPAYGPAPWTYNLSTGGDQVLAVIPINSLLAGSAANGDIPQASQGLHFKLQFVEDLGELSRSGAEPNPYSEPHPNARAVALKPYTFGIAHAHSNAYGKSKPDANRQRRPNGDSAR